MQRLTGEFLRCFMITLGIISFGCSSAEYQDTPEDVFGEFYGEIDEVIASFDEEEGGGTVVAAEMAVEAAESLVMATQGMDEADTAKALLAQAQTIKENADNGADVETLKTELGALLQSAK